MSLYLQINYKFLTTTVKFSFSNMTGFDLKDHETFLSIYKILRILYLDYYK